MASDAPTFVVPDPRPTGARPADDRASKSDADIAAGLRDLKNFIDQPASTQGFHVPQKSVALPLPKKRQKDSDQGSDWAAPVVAWTAFLVSLVLFHFARPEAATMFARFRGRAVRGQWDSDLVPYIIGFLVLDLVAVSAGVVWAYARHGRLAGGLLFQGTIAVIALIGVLVLL